jgi:DNA adenine methylase
MRPALRYYGGKWLLAPWIIEHFPPHRVYVEPYAGAASVLLQKPRCYAEIYNDLDGEVVNVFKTFRDHGKEIERLIRLTPFARDEFNFAYQPAGDPLEQARRTIIKTFMGFGSDSINRKSGFRCDSFRSGTTPGTDWRNYADAIPFMVDRLQGVIIENREAIDVIRKNDRPGSLTYAEQIILKINHQ